MITMKQERGGGNNSKGRGGGGGDGNTNNVANRQNEAELEVLKYVASKIVKKRPTIHNKELRRELSTQEDEWAEMLSGERWEGEEFPRAGGFEKEITLVMTKIKGLATSKISREREKRSKKCDVFRRKGGGSGGHGYSDEDRSEGRGRSGGGGRGRIGGGDDDGGGGGGSGAGGGGGRFEDEFKMSGALRNSASLARPPAPPRKTFLKLDWMHKDNTGSPGMKHDDEDDDQFVSSSAAKIRGQRSGFFRRLSTQPTPTPASRHFHADRMFQKEDDNSGFVGVFDAAPPRRSTQGGNRGGAIAVIRGGTKTELIDLCSDSE